MIKESKNIDFVTTGKEPSALEFKRISEWIKKNKSKSRRKKITKIETAETEDKAIAKN